jgi:hypothetical protein
VGGFRLSERGRRGTIPRPKANAAGPTVHERRRRDFYKHGGDVHEVWRFDNDIPTDLSGDWYPITVPEINALLEP